eukprot:798310-Prymnesium_polylepis.2
MDIAIAQRAVSSSSSVAAGGAAARRRAAPGVAATPAAKMPLPSAGRQAREDRRRARESSASEVPPLHSSAHAAHAGPKTSSADAYPCAFRRQSSMDTRRGVEALGASSLQPAFAPDGDASNVWALTIWRTLSRPSV